MIFQSLNVFNYKKTDKHNQNKKEIKEKKLKPISK